MEDEHLENDGGSSNNDEEDVHMIEDNDGSLDESLQDEGDSSENDEIDELENEWLFQNPFESDDESMWDSESSEEEDDVPEPERRVCILNFVETTVYLYNNVVFRSHFRLQRQVVYDLIERFEQTTFLHNNAPNPNAISHEKAFLMTLWYLANSETFRQIEDRFDLASSSAHKTLIQTLDFVCSLTEEIIKWPDELAEKDQISRRFSRKAHICGIIGAIDGCHIPIRRPIENQIDYLNRKGFHSILLQGVVTSKKLFTDIYVGEPGSLHDSRVLRRSPMYRAAFQFPQVFDGYYLLGDSAYPNLPWIVPPFKDNNHLTEDQIEFNFRHSSTRIKVEHSFGLLKQLFRRLIRIDNVRMDIIIKIIMAACILHNIYILSSDDENDDADEYVNYDYENEHHGDTRQYVFNQMFNLEQGNE